MDNQFLRTDAGESAGRGNAVAVSPAVISNAHAQAPPQSPPPTQSLFAPQTAASGNAFPVVKESRFSPRAKLVGGILLSLTIVVGLVIALIVQRNRQLAPTNQSATNFTTQNIPLAQLSNTGAITLNGRTLNVNGQLRANGAFIMTPAAQPTVPATGELYYDQTSNHLSYFNGTEFVQVQTNKDATGNSTTINNITNLSVASGTVSTSSTLGGTTGKIAKFSSGQTLSDSILTDNNTYLTVNGGLNLTAASNASDFSFWQNQPTPGTINTTENGTLELGVKFQVDVPGVIKSVRFYKATFQDTVTIPVSLWTSAGTLVGQTTITVSGNGWKTATFASPLPVSPDTTYIASYHVNSATPTDYVGYPYTPQYFSGSGVDNGPLHALASGLDGGNGVYADSTTPTVPTQTFNSTNYWIDVVFNGSQLSADSRIRVNNAQISSSDLANDYNLAKRGSSQVFSGHNIFRNSSDSIDVFSIQKADTTPLLSVDAQDSIVYIGKPGGEDTNAPLLVLANKNVTGDPATQASGGMYYNAADGVYRCYANNAWNDCSELDPSRTFSLYDDFMGSQNTSFSNAIGSLGWSAQAIGANGSLSFDPSTPTPVADRPGVLQLTTPASANQGTTLQLGSASGSMIIRRTDAVRTSVAVGATSGLVLRVGIHNETTTTTQPVSGVWWEANPAVNANWRYCYGDGTTAVCTATTTSIAANSWVRLSIIVNKDGTGTSEAVFAINGTASTLSNITVDTTSRLSPAFTCYTTGGTAQNCYWDYFQLTGNTSSPR